jgi:hypothetical protein
MGVVEKVGGFPGNDFSATSAPLVRQDKSDISIHLKGDELAN